MKGVGGRVEGSDKEKKKKCFWSEGCYGFDVWFIC